MWASAVLFSTVGFRYDASEISGKNVAATEVLCYGTAVVIAPEQSA